MTTDHKLRNKIIGWLKQGKKLTDIQELVKKEGGKISLGGLHYIKKNEIEKKSEKKSEKGKEETGHQTKTDSEGKINIEKVVESIKESSKPNVVESLLSDLEFKVLKKSWDTVYLSNLVRLQTANAQGILTALYNVRDIIKTIQKRGNF